MGIWSYIWPQHFHFQTSHTSCFSKLTLHSTILFQRFLFFYLKLTSFTKYFFHDFQFPAPSIQTFSNLLGLNRRRTQLISKNADWPASNGQQNADGSRSLPTAEIWKATSHATQQDLAVRCVSPSPGTSRFSVKEENDDNEYSYRQAGTEKNIQRIIV